MYYCSRKAMRNYPATIDQSRYCLLDTRPLRRCCTNDFFEEGLKIVLRNSQFGFRPRRGTADALMLVRRMIDAALSNNSGGLVLLLLDWAKAFDRLKPECLCAALVRFGLPPPIVDMVKGIYSHRYFTIVDHCGNSSERLQAAGIAQGCPLSPYLFIIVQTVMLADVFSGLQLLQEPDYIVTRDIFICRRHSIGIAACW